MKWFFGLRPSICPSHWPVERGEKISHRRLYKPPLPALETLYLLFAYWLRSSVVSVLSSLITGSLALPSILLLSFFLAFVESPLACYVIRHRWLWHYTTAKCCRLLNFSKIVIFEVFRSSEIFPSPSSG